MRVRLDEVQKGRRGEALGTTSLTYRSGRAALAVAETEQRPTVLGLIASGRMRPDAGTVALDDATDRRAHNALRRRVALVDAPDVSEPAPNIAVAGVVAKSSCSRVSPPIRCPPDAGSTSTTSAPSRGCRSPTSRRRIA
jgi:hypothetical protein